MKCWKMRNLKYHRQRKTSNSRYCSLHFSNPEIRDDHLPHSTDEESKSLRTSEKGRVFFSLVEIPIGVKFKNDKGYIIERSTETTFVIGGECKRTNSSKEFVVMAKSF